MTTDDLTVVAVVGVLVLCSIGSYLVATQKHDPSPSIWGLFGFILGPIGLLMAMFFAGGPSKAGG